MRDVTPEPGSRTGGTLGEKPAREERPWPALTNEVAVAEFWETWHKSPMPFFGGKTHAAPAVWAALGDVESYVEPFFGGGGVLLNRPHELNRTYFSETVNDIDGALCNAWRSIQLHPDETAEAASNPVCEGDLHARHLALLRWRSERNLEHLMGDPLWCDPLMAGWWLWGCCCWIGGGWCSGKGPWVVGEDGRIRKRDKDEPGVWRQRPHLSDDGQGVNHANLREPGVTRQLPHLSDDGQGVNAPQMREPGVEDDAEQYHPVTMPKLRQWFGFLSARLRHVRILNGDWTRAVTGGATLTLPCRMGGGGDGVCGVFLDAPYADTAGRDMGLYAHDSGQVAHAVREWAIQTGPNPRYRIVLAGFEGEHGAAFAEAGWREVEWFKPGFLRGGMGQLGADGHQQGRERLFLSPHCLVPVEEDPCPLFAGMD